MGVVGDKSLDNFLEFEKTSVSQSLFVVKTCPRSPFLSQNFSTDSKWEKKKISDLDEADGMLWVYLCPA